MVWYKHSQPTGLFMACSWPIVYRSFFPRRLSVSHGGLGLTSTLSSCFSHLCSLRSKAICAFRLPHRAPLRSLGFERRQSLLRPTSTRSTLVEPLPASSTSAACRLGSSASGQSSRVQRWRPDPQAPRTPATTPTATGARRPPASRLQRWRPDPSSRSSQSPPAAAHLLPSGELNPLSLLPGLRDFFAAHFFFLSLVSEFLLLCFVRWRQCCLWMDFRLWWSTVT
jgi:hypothetical protein